MRPLPPSRPHDMGNTLARRAIRSDQKIASLGGSTLLDGFYYTPRANPAGGSLVDVGGSEGDGSSSQSCSFAKESWTVTKAGRQVHPCEHIPLPDSMHLWWCPGGGGQIEWIESDHYTVDDEGVVVVLADPLITVGDIFRIQYAYSDGDALALLSLPLGTIYDYIATTHGAGPVAGTSSGPMPFGSVNNPSFTGYGGAKTNVELPHSGFGTSGLWASVEAESGGGDLHFTGTYDDLIEIWIDGVLKHSDDVGSNPSEIIDVTIPVAAGTHTIAFYDATTVIQNNFLGVAIQELVADES